MEQLSEQDVSADLHSTTAVDADMQSLEDSDGDVSPCEYADVPTGQGYSPLLSDTEVEELERLKTPLLSSSDDMQEADREPKGARLSHFSIDLAER
jgi:hypothetical protein